ncbi:hypothetical protein GCM10027020_34820 [Nocardioides salsibiostraticola]
MRKYSYSRRSVGAFIEQHQNDLGSLAKIFANAAHLPTGDETSRVIKDLGNLSPASFVVLESVAGDPQARLASLLSGENPRITLKGPPLPTAFAVESDPFFAFYESLRTMRKSSRHRPSNIADAVALRILVELNSGEPPYPRFYTSTRTLRRLFESHRWVRDYFDYEYEDGRGGSKSRTIWRTAPYYYLRSLFPALRFDKPEAKAPSIGPSIDELDDLAQLLNTAIFKPADMSGIMSEYRFSNGDRLDDFVGAFLNIGSARSWLKLPLDDVVKRAVVGATELDQIRKDPNIVEAALTRLWRSAEDAGAQVAEASFSIDLATVIVERLGQWRAREQGHVDLTLKTTLVQDDLVAYRWGNDFDSRFIESVIEVMENGSAPSKLLERVSIPVLRDDSRAAKTVMAVLYSLEAFEAVGELWAIIRSSHADQTAPQLIALAAKVRQTKRAGWNDGLRQAQQGLELLWRAASELECRDLALGFGTALLHAQPSPGSYLPDRHPPLKNSALDQVAGALVRDLTKATQPDMGRYAFQLNFALVLDIGGYLGEDVDASSLALELTRLMLSERRFSKQYRFADTLAYREARRAIRRLKVDGISSGACADLTASHARLAVLAGQTRSTVIRSHREEVALALREYGCATHLTKPTSGATE